MILFHRHTYVPFQRTDLIQDVYEWDADTESWVLKRTAKDEYSTVTYQCTKCGKQKHEIVLNPLT